MQMFLTGTDHPVTESTTADRNTGAFEGLCQTVERCAVDVFVHECEGQRRGRGDAARQGLRRHRRCHNRRVDPGAVAMAASIFEPHILQDLCLHLDMKLLGNALAHAMHLAMAARTSLLIIGKVIFDALARQVFRKRSAATFLTRCAFDRRQACIRKVDDVVLFAVGVILIRSLLSFVEDAINVLFAARRITMQPCQRQLFFEFDDTFGELTVLSLQRRNARQQLFNTRFAGSIHLKS